jgi:hypothetical protein
MGLVVVLWSASVALVKALHVNWLMAIPGLAILGMAGVVLLSYFRLGSTVVPLLSPAEMDNTEDVVRATLVKSHLLAAHRNAGATRFHADTFRASLRLFVVGVIVVLGTALTMGTWP